MVGINENQARADAREAVRIVVRVGMSREGFAGASGLSVDTARRILAGGVPSQARTRAALHRFVRANLKARSCADVTIVGAP